MRLNKRGRATHAARDAFAAIRNIVEKVSVMRLLLVNKRSKMMRQRSQIIVDLQRLFSHWWANPADEA
jgi:hypothetical protein